MNNYNNYAPMGAQQQYGYNPAFGGTRYGQAPQIRFSQPLTTEKAKLLRGNSAKFNLAVTQSELDRACCTHKNIQTNSIALMDNNDGTETCTECTETFSLLPLEMAGSQEVQDIVNQFLNLLQSIKTYYVTLPDKTIEEFFSMIPYVKKVPEFFTEAANVFRRYCGGYSGVTVDNDQYGWGMLNSMTNPGFMGMPMNNGFAGNPVNNFPYANQPNGGYYDQQQGQAPGPNPFGFNGAQQQAPAYGQQPMYGAQQQAPAYGQQPMYGAQQQPAYGAQQQAYAQPNVPNANAGCNHQHGATEQVAVNNNGQAVATKTETTTK